VLLDEGIDRLRPFAPSCHEIDVASLIADATRARQQLAELGPTGMNDVDVVGVAPRIRFTT